jgi:hypothetical protein
MRAAIHASFYAALLLAGCSLTRDPNGVEAPKGVRVAAGTFVKTYVPLSASSDSNPFRSLDVREQMLYTAAEVGGGGRISAIRFQRAAPGPEVTCPNVAVRFGHTSLTALTTTFPNNVDSSSLATALLSGSITIPAGDAGTLFELKLATPYEYDGFSNLVVEIELTAGCSSDCHFTSDVLAPPYKAMAYLAADTDPNTSQINASSTQVGPGRLATRFVFSGGEDYLAYAGTLASTNNLPLAPTTTGYHVLNVHRAADIAGSGPVTGVAFQLGQTSVAGTYTTTVKMGHHSGLPGGSVSTVWIQNYADAPVTIADNVSFSVPAGRPAGDWIWIPVTEGAFSYNGKDDLVVEVITSTATGGAQLLRYQSRSGARGVASSTSSPTTETVDNVAFHLGLRFAGGPVFVTQQPWGSGAAPLLGSAIGAAGGYLYQSLYEPHRIGTGGTIDRIGVRIRDNASTAATIPNMKIYMGETTKSAFAVTDTFASNMDGQTLVYSGRLDVPAGLKFGDWLDIPLQTAFAYDARKNLVVLFNEDAATAANYVFVSTAPSALKHSVYYPDTNMSATPYSTCDGFVDLRLNIQR